MSVNLYGPSGTDIDPDILRLILDLTAAVKSIQLGFFIAPGAVTDEKVAADAAIAQSKIANLIADLANRATTAALTAESTARAAADNTRLPLAGGTLTGALVLPANAAAALQAVPKQQLDSGLAVAAADLTAEATARATGDNSRLPLAGGTLTGALVLAGDAASALQAVPKQQLDTAVAAATIPDATTTVKGKLQLAGDLGGTAALPTVPGLAARALDSAVVHNTGAETVAGVKTFSAAPVVPAAAFPESAVANLTTDLAAKLPLAGGTLTGALVLAANAAAALQAVPKQQLDSGLALKADAAATTAALALKADDNAVVKLTGDQTKTARLTMRSLGVEPVAADNGAFALKGRHWTGIVGAVPYVVPTGPGADQLVALDLVVKGTPVNTPDLGVAWIDICDSNEAEVDADNYQATRIGKTRDGYGYLTIAEGDGSNGSNPNALPLVLQHMGGNVGIGPGAKAPSARLHVDGNVLAGGATLTGPLVLPADAASALHAVPKQQLDTAVATATKLNPGAATQTIVTPAAPHSWVRAHGSGVPRSIIEAHWDDFNGSEYTVSPRVLRITDRGDIQQQGAHLISGSMTAFFPTTMLEVDSDLGANSAIVATMANIASQYPYIGGIAQSIYYGVDALGGLHWANGTAIPALGAAFSFDTALTREAAGSLLLDGQLHVKATATASTLLVIDAKAAQTADLLQVRDSVGGTYFKVSPSTGAGMLVATIGQGGGTRLANAMLSIAPVSTTDPGTIMKRPAGYSGKFWQLRTESDVQLAAFDSSGKLTIGGTGADSGASLNIENANGTGTLFNFSGNTNYIRGVSTQIDTNVGFKKAPVTTPQTVAAAATDAATTQTLANSLRTILIAYGLAA